MISGPPDFERVKLIGQGDVGKVYLVRLKSTRSLFAMKILSKTEMIARNKVLLRVLFHLKYPVMILFMTFVCAAQEMSY